jgi:hypothetical protein
VRIVVETNHPGTIFFSRDNLSPLSPDGFQRWNSHPAAVSGVSAEHAGGWHATCSARDVNQDDSPPDHRGKTT